MAGQRGGHGPQPVQRRAGVPVLIARAGLGLLLVAAAAACVPTPARARVLIDRDRALAQVFGPAAKIRPRTVFLTAEEGRRAEQAAGAKLASVRVLRYEATRGDSLVGTGYLDTHRVRTMNETILVAITPQGRVRAVEILAFDEPDDYRAPRRWLEKFEDKALSRDLRPGGAVPNLGGATLTGRAIGAAVRRTLALHAAIAARDGGARR